jgi:excisionase family DNA binding protein
MGGYIYHGEFVNGWKEYLKKGGVQLNTGVDKRLCITVPEDAEMLGISRNFGYELVKQGELPVIRLGEKRLVISRPAL